MFDKPIILAGTYLLARKTCDQLKIPVEDTIIVHSLRTLEGLRFEFNDVVFAEGWQTRSDIVEIMDLIKRYNVMYAGRVKESNNG